MSPSNTVDQPTTSNGRANPSLPTISTPRFTRKDSTLKKMKRIDRQAMVDAWKPKTDIINRIKKNNPDQPFKVDITYDIAMDLLTLNDPGQNRTINESKLAHYTELMLNNEWQDNAGDTFCFDVNIKMIDGQKRCWGVVESGRPLKDVIISTGHPPKIFAYKDLGQVRNANDIASIMGYKNVGNILSRAVKNIILFDTKSQVRGTVSEQQVNSAKVLSFFEKKTIIDRMVRDIEYIRLNWMKNNPSFFQLPEWLFLFYILHSLPGKDEEAKKFMDQFGGKGSNLAETNPILVLRSYFIQDFKHLYTGKLKNSITKSNLTIKVKHVIRAWNLHVEKVRLKEFTVDLTTLDIEKPRY